MDMSCIKFVVHKRILMCQISTFILEFNIFGLIIVDIAEFLFENLALCLLENVSFDRASGVGWA